MVALQEVPSSLYACASAADWDAEQADRWWADKVPSVPIDSPSQPVGVES